MDANFFVLQIELEKEEKRMMQLEADTKAEAAKVEEAYKSQSALEEEIRKTKKLTQEETNLKLALMEEGGEQTSISCQLVLVRKV